MKTITRFLSAGTATLLLALGQTALVHADPAVPLFGSSQVIDGTIYSYTGSTEDETTHSDNYVDSNGNTLTLQGKIDVASLGKVSGAFTGYYQNLAFYPYQQSYSDVPVSVSGANGSYTTCTGTTTYDVDLVTPSVFVVSFSNTYSGPNGSFSVSATNGHGTISGSESGVVVNGEFYFNSSSSQSWSVEANYNPRSLFGSTYSQTYQGSSTTYDETGTPTGLEIAEYQSGDGGSYTVRTDQNGGLAHGNDPYVGSWTLDSGTIESGNVAFAALGAPRFRPSGNNTLVIWVNGTVVNWSGSTLNDVMGNITDHWSSADDAITITMSGNARGFVTSGDAATVTVNINGSSYGGTLTLAGGLSFSTPQDIQFSDPNRSTPLFTAGTLYVDNVPFAFAGGYEDAFGNRTDRYEHTSGTLSLNGSSASPAQAAVVLSRDGSTWNGSFASGSFAFVPPENAPVISTYPLVGSDALWVDGVLYARVPGTNDYSTAGGAQVITLSGTDPAALSLAGTHSNGSVAGTCNAARGGVFAVTVNNNPHIACFAAADGTPQPGPGDALPEGFPAAVKVQDAIWGFLGVVADEDGGGDVACYGCGQETVDGTLLVRLSLLNIRVAAASGSTHGTSLRCYAGLQSGEYDSASGLFQTNTTSNAALPPLYRTEPPAHTRWLNTPPAGLPPSFLVRGQPWWHAGTDAQGNSLYRGFHSGQQMTLGAADSEGQRLVTLSNPLSNGGSTTQGTLSSERGSVRLRDGTLVVSGTDQGAQQQITHADDYRLQTIAADLDIVGNNLSFGILQGDASLAGALWQFADIDNTATLYQTLSRPQAQWLWARAADSSGQSTLPVMKLDASHKLTLYDSPATAQTAQNAGVVLDPAEDGISTIRGVLRVRPGGDIDMGEFQAGGEP